MSLVHIPTGISVQCQEQRDLTSNRRIARKLLRDKIDLAMNGDESRLGRKFERIRKKKRNSARRAAKKYANGPDGIEIPQEELESSDETDRSDDSDEEDINASKS